MAANRYDRKRGAQMKRTKKGKHAMVEKRSKGRPKNEPLKIDRDWFQAQMKERHLTQRAVAEILGRSPEVLTRQLQGKQTLTPKDVAKLADLFECSSSEVLARLGVPVTEEGVTIAGKILNNGRVSSVFARKGGTVPVMEFPKEAQALIVDAETGPLAPYNDAAFIVLPPTGGDASTVANFGRLCVVEADEHVTPLVGTLGKGSDRGTISLEVFGVGEKIKISKVHSVSPVIAILLQ